jgi:hypothetical protein
LVLAVEDVFAQVFDGVAVFTALDHKVDAEGELFLSSAIFRLKCCRVHLRSQGVAY